MVIKEIGSEFDWQSNEPFQTERQTNRFDCENIFYFRSGRDALKAIARACTPKTTTVLLPALSCESMVSPFLMNGYDVLFYKLNPDYTIDQKDLESKMQKGCLFLYMAYFGIEPINSQTLKAIKERFSAVLIEDRTQNALHEIQQPVVADFIVISVRKWLAIPDGGFLVSQEPIEIGAEKEGFFAATRERAMKLKSEYLKKGDQNKKEQFRSLLNQANDVLDQSEKAFAMAADSRSKIRAIDFERILKDRQNNVHILKQGLYALAYQGKISFITNQPELSTLYFPILVNNRDFVQGELAKAGIYCPVIWPVPKLAKGICSVADMTADNMLALPCDQRYGESEMKFIIEKLNEIINV